MFLTRDVFKIYGEEIKCRIEKYCNNGGTALTLESLTGEPFGVASINTDYNIEKDEIVLKNYSENKDIAIELLKNNILIKTNKFVEVGNSICPICTINFNKFDEVSDDLI